MTPKRIVIIVAVSTVAIIGVWTLFLGIGFLSYLLLGDFWLSYILGLSAALAPTLLVLAYMVKRRKKRRGQH